MRILLSQIICFTFLAINSVSSAQIRVISGDPLTESSFVGKFVRTGNASSISADRYPTQISEVEFMEGKCEIIYKNTKIRGTYKVDQKNVYITTDSALGNLTFTIYDINRLNGQSQAHGVFRRHGSFVPLKNSEAGNEQFNTSNGSSQSINPFGDGSGGDGSGEGNGVRYASNYNRSSVNRTRLNNVSLENIETEATLGFGLDLLIDAFGNVLEVEFADRSTLTKYQLAVIDPLISAVKEQVKYNADPGSENVYVHYYVRVEAD